MGMKIRSIIISLILLLCIIIWGIKPAISQDEPPRSGLTISGTISNICYFDENENWIDASLCIDCDNDINSIYQGKICVIITAYKHNNYKDDVNNLKSAIEMVKQYGPTRVEIVITNVSYYGVEDENYVMVCSTCNRAIGEMMNTVGVGGILEPKLK